MPRKLQSGSEYLVPVLAVTASAVIKSPISAMIYSAISAAAITAPGGTNGMQRSRLWGGFAASKLSARLLGGCGANFGLISNENARKVMTTAQGDEVGLFLPLEGDCVRPARFADPEPVSGGDATGIMMLFDAARLALRSGAGPFRSSGRISVVPRELLDKTRNRMKPKPVQDFGP
jgi:hypothetical protein